MAFELDVVMTRYNTASKRLQDSLLNKSSSALAQRRNIEQEYALSVRELSRHGYMMRIKQKYTRV